MTENIASEGVYDILSDNAHGFYLASEADCGVNGNDKGKHADQDDFAHIL